MDLAQTLACSLILSRIDYCNAVLHGAPSTSCSGHRQCRRYIVGGPPNSQYNCEAPRGWGVGRGCALQLCSAVPPPQNFFLHFHVEMAHFVGILAVNFKFYCMNKTVKIHQNPTDTLLAVIFARISSQIF